MPKSDLSTLFEDWALVRPTQLALVPRVVEMLFQRYQSQVDRLVGEGDRARDADETAKAELREQYWAGGCSAGSSAPHRWPPRCGRLWSRACEVHVVDGYGLTEIGGGQPRRRHHPPAGDRLQARSTCPSWGTSGTDRPYPRGELLVKTATACPATTSDPRSPPRCSTPRATTAPAT